MFKWIGSIVRTVLTVLVIMAIVAGVVGYYLGHRSAAPAAPAVPVASAASTTQWWADGGVEFHFGVGNPTAPAAAPAAPIVPPVVPPPVVTPIGQQAVFAPIWDYCCGETTVPNPIVLETENGNLFAWEYRGGNPYREFVAGPDVVSVINTVSGWEPNSAGGGWTPYFMVTYQTTTGIMTTGLINTRAMFGR
ncbi:MAG: hypothetical protein Q8N65_01990 [bacterium]|nr:hypothetical protein [bacterium]